jgi:hypothetical protein
MAGRLSEYRRYFVSWRFPTIQSECIISAKGHHSVPWIGGPTQSGSALRFGVSEKILLEKQREFSFDF